MTRLTEAGLWAYVDLRYGVLEARRAGLPEPWTDDPALSRWHFPNVHRMDDRGTRWFHDALAVRGWDDDPRLALWASVAYRLLNHLPTFQRHGDEWALPEPEPGVVDAWVALLRADMAAGLKVSTSRHFTRGLSRYRLTLHALVDRLDHLSDRVTQRALAEGVPGATDALQHLPWVGPFFSWQVLCDLIEAELVPLTADDGIHLGPGASNALHMMDAGVEVETYEWGKTPGRARIAELEAVARDVAARQPEARWPRLTLIDLEHALCEYLRWARITAGLATGQARD